MTDSEQLERLVAEAEIRRVIARYCRGIDRLDLDLVRSCYHDDAHDEHGSFSGSVDAYLDWVRPLLVKYDATMHFIGNQLVEFDDADTARVETYGMSVHRSASDAPHLNLTTGFRFIDRFERRGGEWRIAQRVAVPDWSLRHRPDDWWPLPGHHRIGRRDAGDALYTRDAQSPEPSGREAGIPPSSEAWPERPGSEAGPERPGSEAWPERPGSEAAESGETELSGREAGIPPSSEAWPERPGSEAAESGETELSGREAGIPPSSEAWPERPGSEAAESGETELSGREAGIPPSSEAWPERPGSEAAESGE